MCVCVCVCVCVCMCVRVAITQNLCSEVVVRNALGQADRIIC